MHENPHPRSAAERYVPTLSAAERYAPTLSATERYAPTLCSALLLAGVCAAGFAVFRMHRCQYLNDPERVVFWQRMRVVSQGLAMSAGVLPFILPHLADSALFLRTS